MIFLKRPDCISVRKQEAIDHFCNRATWTLTKETVSSECMWPSGQSCTCHALVSAVGSVRLKACRRCQVGSQGTYVLVLAFCASEDRLQVIISIIQFLLQLCHLRTEKSLTKRQHAGSKTLDSTQQGCFCMPSGLCGGTADCPDVCIMQKGVMLPREMFCIPLRTR